MSANKVKTLDINEPQSITLLRLHWLKSPHFTNVILRYDGQDMSFEADWLWQLIDYYLKSLQTILHKHKYTIDLGDPCFCGSDNCAACEVCLKENHD